MFDIIIECGGLFLEIVLIFLVQLRIYALVFIFYIFLKFISALKMIIIHNDANISILLNKNGFKNKSFMDRKKNK